jgi:hypothetical protein
MTNSDPEKRPTTNKVNKILAGLVDLAWGSIKHLGRPILHYQEEYNELKTLGRHKSDFLVERIGDNH